MRIRPLLALTALFLLLSAVWAPTARADDDSIRHFDVTYDVQPDAAVDVTVEMDWHFGEVGRRGIQHDIIIREPWDDDFALDAVQRVTDVDAYSPSGATDSFTVSEEDGMGHERVLRVTIGDENSPLDLQDATYVIEFTVEGAMRTFDGEPELHVDVVSDGSTPIDTLTAEVTGPDDVTFARCLLGESECGSEIVGGDALYEASGVHSALTVVAIFPPGSVEGAEPILEETGRLSDSNGNRLLASLGVIVAIVGTVFGVSKIGRQRDERYVGVSPTLTDPGGPVKKAKRFEVPVQFHPPKIPVHQAGVLLERRYGPAQLAATLISMALRGAVTLGSRPLMVQPADASASLSDVETRLATHASPEQQLPLKRAREMGGVMSGEANRTLNSSGFFQQKPRINGPIVAYFLVWVLTVAISLVAYMARDWLGPFFLPVLIAAPIGGFLGGPALMIMSTDPGRGLTADGTAMLDQVEGFRTYIATAEAEQLSLQADQDIFTRYLPWAVLFDLTERWTRVCRELAALGVIPPVETSVVQGSGEVGSSVNRFRSEMSSASTRPSGGSSGSRSGRSSGGGGSGGGGSRSRSW